MQYVITFLEGIITFISPCLLPMIPIYLSYFAGGATVIVRPFGTEPKIKTYFTTLGKDLAEAEVQKAVLAKALKPILA